MSEANEAAADIQEVRAWAVGLEALHARFSPRFARAKPRRRVPRPRGCHPYRAEVPCPAHPRRNDEIAELKELINPLVAELAQLRRLQPVALLAK